MARVYTVRVEYIVRVEFTHKASGLILNKTFHFSTQYLADLFADQADNLENVHSVSKEQWSFPVYESNDAGILALKNEINRED